jgi:hypothetical protein
MQAGGIEPTLEGADGAELEITGKQAPDQDCMVLDDVQGANPAVKNFVVMTSSSSSGFPSPTVWPPTANEASLTG